jgi:positive regulator of sigma E activity
MLPLKKNIQIKSIFQIIAIVFFVVTIVLTQHLDTALIIKLAIVISGVSLPVWFARKYFKQKKHDSEKPLDLWEYLKK